ncbi:unnamed protein product [Wuchereria bancrofti]|uniref:Uncharacterized protein n=1 Tax=Wuchereria bancrofti TaxID=6293 RepID=A0A3P7E8H1_WUCBA|nr:unnamed protein product [Wuchereria bancrofti]
MIRYEQLLNHDNHALFNTINDNLCPNEIKIGSNTSFVTKYSTQISNQSLFHIPCESKKFDPKSVQSKGRLVSIFEIEINAERKYPKMRNGQTSA